MKQISTHLRRGLCLIALTCLGVASPTRADSAVFFSDAQGVAIPSGAVFRSNHYLTSGTAYFIGQYASASGADTIFSSSIQPGPGVTAGLPNINNPIAAGQVILLDEPVAAVYDDRQPGIYQASITLHNELNPEDPDDTVTGEMWVYAPPAFSGPTVIDFNAGEPVVLSIDAPEPGGLMAGGRRFGASFSNGFSIDALNLFDEIQPGQTVTAPVRYNPNRYGRLTSVHVGHIRLSFDPITEAGENILPKKQNGTPSLLESYEYELRYTYVDTLFDTVSINAGDPIVWNDIGVNTASVAAIINRGRPSADLTIEMAIEDNPLPVAGPDDPRLVSDAVRVGFSEPGGLYGLELRIDPANIPGDAGNAELALLGFDADTQAWVPAVTLNSDGGAGARAGTISLGRTIGSRDLIAGDLGLYGRSNSNIFTFWAVLDTPGLFAVGLLPIAPIPGDLSGDGDVDDEDLGLFFAAFTGPDLSQGPLIESAADLSGDGDVDDEDLGLAFSGFTGPLVPANVPEPASGALLGWVAAWIGRRRR